MTDRIQIVQQLYSAFADGDTASLQNLLADTHWVEAAGMPYDGTYQGFGQIAENVFGPITDDVLGYNASPDEIIEAGEDRVLALGFYRGKRFNRRGGGAVRASMDRAREPHLELRSVRRHHFFSTIDRF